MKIRAADDGLTWTADRADTEWTDRFSCTYYAPTEGRPDRDTVGLGHAQQADYPERILPSPGTALVFHWHQNNAHIGADEAALRCARSALSVPGSHGLGIDSGYHARPSHEFRRFAGAAPTALVAQRGPHLNHLMLD